MLGKLTSLENGPERNVKLTISATELSSEISSPGGVYQPESVDHYEVAGLREHAKAPATLTFVLADGRRVQFYSTESKFDMALLLDQLDGTIGERPRQLT
jgi:hypothetical protein